jgi:molybdopterin synthase sulfur carrier subunit
MIDVHYFANIREMLGVAREQVALPQPATVAALIDALVVQHGGRWQSLFNETRVLTAVNQVVVPITAAIKDGDEVAFFPPVTGG